MQQKVSRDPKHSPEILKSPSRILSDVLRLQPRARLLVVHLQCDKRERQHTSFHTKHRVHWINIGSVSLTLMPLMTLLGTTFYPHF